MADNFQSHPPGLDSPARRHYAISPSDTVDLLQLPRALRVLTSGNLALRDELGTVITYAVTAGEILPFRAMRVMATGTTATVVGWE